MTSLPISITCTKETLGLAPEKKFLYFPAIERFFSGEGTDIDFRSQCCNCDYTLSLFVVKRPKHVVAVTATLTTEESCLKLFKLGRSPELI